jgi:hypothetical protein
VADDVRTFSWVNFVCERASTEGWIPLKERQLHGGRTNALVDALATDGIQGELLHKALTDEHIVGSRCDLTPPLRDDAPCKRCASDSKFL